jgi:hypothetical protein
METKSKYREIEKNKVLSLINENEVFNGDKGKKNYFLKEKKLWRPKADLLINSKNNLYPQIKDEIVLYFALNKIAFHHLNGDADFGFCIPSGHTLSSQIACLNHLYPLRYDKNAVLQIAKTICSDIADVFEIKTDEYFPAYIAFEVVSDIDHLNEKCSSRGTMCTSVDALIYVKHKNGKRILLPIEWKYTECYDDEDLSIEDRPYKPKGNEKKGEERLRRYSDLISQSTRLKTLPNYRSSVYFFDPFYQLMRQTLWAEQMKAQSGTETIKADDFIHVHVIPQENKDLLDKIYPCSGKDMETTWRDCLNNQDKYKNISPKDLLANIDDDKYADLIKYLETRYW